MLASTLVIYFIACHGGPSAHFSEFAKELRHEGFQVEILATGPALDKLESCGGKEFNPDHLNIEDPSTRRLLAAKIAESIGTAAIAIITDVGHLLMADVQEAIAEKAPNIKRLAYYENPEPFVPGGYSQTAAKVMTLAQKVLFANKNLAQETLFEAPGIPYPLPLEKRTGIGYYPLQTAKFLKAARGARKEIARRLFFEERKIADTGQKILLYLGGNNEVYFKDALPAFLHLLRESRLDPSQYLILMQHHPGAKKREIDFKLAGGHPIFVSNTSSEEALILADAALYYQTSMGPLLTLAGIPAIQVGHETYPDILVRNGLAPSATTKESFFRAVHNVQPPSKNPKLLEDLGISPDWRLRLQSAIQQH